MHYLDTSVLTSYYCAEERSPRVQRVLAGIDEPTISPLVQVEFCCAVARKVRAGVLGRSDALRILSQFRLHLAEPRYVLISVGAVEYSLAAEWIARLTVPLRVLDALHLAAVFANDLVLVTADNDLARAAKTLGVKHNLIS